MRTRVAVPAAAVLALGLAGCATVGRIGMPAPSPPPVRAAEVAALPPPSEQVAEQVTEQVAPPPAPLSPQPELPPPPPAPPAPTLVKPPPTAVAPPVTSSPVTPSSPPVPSPPGPAVPPAPPPRILGQQVSSEDEKRIQGDAQRRIERTERLVKQIDQRRLIGDQHQNLLTVQSFLVKAREALSEKDVQRALTLADKAFLLAEELVKVVR
jgi:hypothetical protein